MSGKLSFKEFLALPRSEQNVRYRELSDHDRFLARMSDWGAPDPDPERPKRWPPSEEDWKRILEIFNGESKD